MANRGNLHNDEASSVLFTTTTIRLSMTYGVYISISGGVSRGRVCYQLWAIYTRHSQNWDSAIPLIINQSSINNQSVIKNHQKSSINHQPIINQSEINQSNLLINQPLIDHHLVISQSSTNQSSIDHQPSINYQ